MPNRKAFLTILTRPILPWQERTYRTTRRIVRSIVKPHVPLPPPQVFPGHPALCRSVVEGLRKIGADFNYNPTRFSELSRIVYTPENNSLRQAIELKRQGRIDFLVAGPVNGLSPDDADGLICDPELDLYVTASDWVAELMRRDVPSLRNKICVCPAGVDTSWWMPQQRMPTSSQVTIYWKTESREFYQQVETIVRSSGLNPVCCRYGHYTVEELRRQLQESLLAVFISRYETQGLALAETWSMDVPTLVWDPQGPAEFRGYQFQAGSSCPYLTQATGTTWKTLADLAALLGAARKSIDRYSPRSWVLGNLTDAICANRLYTAIIDLSRSESRGFGCRTPPSIRPRFAASHAKSVDL